MPHFPHRAGNYVLFAELGTGTVGTTYIGRQLGHMRTAFKPLVVRVLDPHLSQRAEIVRVFLDEQRAAALIQHPRIASIQEIGVMPDGNYFVASEYVHGVPLREVQRTIQTQLTPAQALHVAMQLCDALHYAHERLDVTGKPLRIVHGQLSPDAVMIGFDGNTKVIEFGLLRTRDAATATIPTLLQRRTAFLSPELRAQLPLRTAPQLDRRADIYSIGALLWEMLTGESLVPTDDGAQQRPPSAVRPVDPQMDGIVMRAMAKAPGDRFPTAQALRLALTTVAASLSSEGSVATGLARSLTVTFRDRMVAFQEQLDLWRKIEDEVLPESQEPQSRTGFTPSRTGFTPSGTGPGLSGRRTTLSGINPAYQSHPSLTSSQRAIAVPPGTTTPVPRTPLPGPAPPPSPWKGRLFGSLLFLAIIGIVVGSALIILRPHHPQKSGVLLVDSQPRGAQILLDGQAAGTTPHRISDIGAGPVHIEVRKEGYRPWTRDVSSQAGKTVHVEAELEAEPH